MVVMFWGPSSSSLCVCSFLERDMTLPDPLCQYVKARCIDDFVVRQEQIYLGMWFKNDDVFR